MIRAAKSRRGQETAARPALPQKTAPRALRVVILGRRQLCGDCLTSLFDRYLEAVESRVVVNIAQVRNAFEDDQPPHVAVYSAICSYGLNLVELRDFCIRLAPIPIVVHVDVPDAALIQRIIGAGAKGVIPTTLQPRLAAAVLQLVAAGEIYVPSAEHAHSVAPLQQDEPVSLHGGLSRLTPRQISVLRLATEGKSNKEIAHELGIGQNTTKVHIATLMRKLGVENRVRLAVVASRMLSY